MRKPERAGVTFAAEKSTESAGPPGSAKLRTSRSGDPKRTANKHEPNGRQISGAGRGRLSGLPETRGAVVDDGAVLAAVREQRQGSTGNVSGTFAVHGGDGLDDAGSVGVGTLSEDPRGPDEAVHLPDLDDQQEGERKRSEGLAGGGGRLLDQAV